MVDFTNASEVDFSICEQTPEFVTQILQGENKDITDIMFGSLSDQGDQATYGNRLAMLACAGTKEQHETEQHGSIPACMYWELLYDKSSSLLRAEQRLAALSAKVLVDGESQPWIAVASNRFIGMPEAATTFRKWVKLVAKDVEGKVNGTAWDHNKVIMEARRFCKDPEAVKVLRPRKHKATPKRIEGGSIWHRSSQLSYMDTSYSDVNSVQSARSVTPPVQSSTPPAQDDLTETSHLLSTADSVQVLSAGSVQNLGLVVSQAPHQVSEQPEESGCCCAVM